jgi:hypothetical protein
MEELAKAAQNRRRMVLIVGCAVMAGAVFAWLPVGSCSSPAVVWVIMGTGSFVLGLSMVALWKLFSRSVRNLRGVRVLLVSIVGVWVAVAVAALLPGGDEPPLLFSVMTSLMVFGWPPGCTEYLSARDAATGQMPTLISDTFRIARLMTGSITVGAAALAVILFVDDRTDRPLVEGFLTAGVIVHLVVLIMMRRQLTAWLFLVAAGSTFALFLAAVSADLVSQDIKEFPQSDPLMMPSMMLWLILDLLLGVAALRIRSGALDAPAQDLLVVAEASRENASVSVAANDFAVQGGAVASAKESHDHSEKSPHAH